MHRAKSIGCLAMLQKRKDIDCHRITRSDSTVASFLAPCFPLLVMHAVLTCSVLVGVLPRGAKVRGKS
eukprot:1446030-Amphidinium_carterae.1